MSTSSVLQQDRRHVWHPYDSTTSPGAVRRVVGAAGARLVLDDGSGPVEVVDAMASWWCQVHGYRNPVLDEAVRTQVGAFSHVMLGGLTHDPAVRLAEQLAALAPDPLERVFLADSGSVGMEVACKLARQWQLGRPGGSRRTRFAALRGGYHGDTWGVMALCDPEGGMHSMYAGAVQQHLFLPRPPAFAADEAAVAAWVAEARAALVREQDTLAAVVVEPILQGAGGMWAWAPGALRGLREVCEELELLLVADEIATGMGRTGRFFACEWAGVIPDVLVVGKALTGGYVTQAAVITSQDVAAAVSDGPGGALMHGPTFMGNPLACAVSSASLTLLQESWADQVPRLETRLEAGLSPLRSREGVRDVRVLGGIAAVQLDRPVDVPVATDAAVAAGVWIRPFRDLVYAMPPYVCSDEEVATVTGGLTAAVEAVLARDPHATAPRDSAAGSGPTTTQHPDQED